ELKAAQAQLQAQKTEQTALAKQYEASQKAQQQLQAKLTQQEEGFTTAQAQLKKANTDIAQLQKEIEKQKQLMTQASDQQVKSLTVELTQQVSLLKLQEAVLKKAEEDSRATREALAKQQAVAKQLAEQNKQLQAQLKDNEQQAAKLQTVLTAQTAQTEQHKALEAELKQQMSLTSNEALKAQIMELNKKVMQLQDENDKLKAKIAPSGSTSIMGAPKKQLSQKELKAIAQANAKRNQRIIEEITKQKYSKLDSFTYYKILQKGKPITNVQKKNITFIMREQLTDGTLTVLYKDQEPVTLPYSELPAPLNSFVEKAGEGGMVKVYIKPEGGYGVDGIPGVIPPNSMSIIDLKIISAK
ncbi:hypothetical protein AAAA14_16120, partial [Providencia stuartii]